MLVKLTPNEIRVLGCLIEKEITTPDQYPLSLNALTNACNQKSNREPVMSLSEASVKGVVDILKSKDQIFNESHTGGRVLKFKHRFCNTEFNDLQLTEQQLGVICVLFLRGPQTPGELKTRTNRLCMFQSVEEVEQVLITLSQHEKGDMVVKLPREPGKRENRYAHLFGGEVKSIEMESVNTSTMNSRDNLQSSSIELKETDSNKIYELENRIENLETTVASLQKLLNEITR